MADADVTKVFGAKPKPRRSLTRWALALMAGLLLLAVLLTVAGALLHLPAASVMAWQARMWHFKIAGISMQLLAAAVIGWRWPDVVAWAARRGFIRHSEQRAALAARRKAVLLLMALIVFVGIGPGDLARLIRAFTG